jgi:hypothetical protein
MQNAARRIAVTAMLGSAQYEVFSPLPPVILLPYLPFLLWFFSPTSPTSCDFYGASI